MVINMSISRSAVTAVTAKHVHLCLKIASRVSARYETAKWGVAGALRSYRSVQTPFTIERRAEPGKHFFPKRFPESAGLWNPDKEVPNMNGLWHTRFNAGPAHGDGIVVLRDGEILGGDASHIYTGSYHTDGPLVYFDVHVARWLEKNAAADSESPRAFFFRGSVHGDSATVSGHPDDRREVTIAVELHRAA